MECVVGHMTCESARTSWHTRHVANYTFHNSV